MVVEVLFKTIKFTFPIAVLIIAMWYHTGLKLYYYKHPTEVNTLDRTGIFSKSRLAQYDGVGRNDLFVAVLGIVFNVKEGEKHYQKGAAYNYFVGKDGSRALVTGDFKDESDEKDHVIDLPCKDLFTLVHWRNTFRKKYTEVGVHIGRYFDDNGQETAYCKEFNDKIKQCEVDKENAKKEDQKFPPCNIAWSNDEGTKVWCTKSSGGVKRNWIGVPRQLYTPGVENPRCVCINEEEHDSPSLIKEYEGCTKMSSECIVST